MKPINPFAQQCGAACAISRKTDFDEPTGDTSIAKNHLRSKTKVVPTKSLYGLIIDRRQDINGNRAPPQPKQCPA